MFTLSNYLEPKKLYPPKKYRKQGICLTSGAIIKTFQNISFYIGPKILASCSIFYETVEKKLGSYDALT